MESKLQKTRRQPRTLRSNSLESRLKTTSWESLDHSERKIRTVSEGGLPEIEIAMKFVTDIMARDHDALKRLAGVDSDET